MSREVVIGKGWFDTFPTNLGTSQLSQLQLSFDRVIADRQTQHLQHWYDLTSKDNILKEKHWTVVNVPVLDEDGNVKYILHNATDVTESISVKKSQSDLSGMEKAYHLFMNAPVIIGVLRGNDYIIELANEGLLEVWSRTDSVIGQPLLQAVPELGEQGIKPLLDEVCITGKPFYAYEFPISLQRKGVTETFYFDFVYKPFYEGSTGQKASGVIGVGHDVTAQVLARRQANESEGKYRNLFDSIDQGFCILEMMFDDQGRPVDYRFLETNPVFEKQTGLREVEGKTALELVPNLEFHWLGLYGKVAITGTPIRFTERSEAMGRWFEVFAFRVGEENSRKVALLFTDVSERRKAEEAIKLSERNLRNTILQAPAAMCILRGEDFIIEVANQKMFELWGITQDYSNRPIFEALPKARDEGYEALLTGVLRTGQPFIGKELSVSLPRNGQLETVFVDLNYEAIVEVDGSISGIMAMAIDVTEKVLARQKVEDLVTIRTKELEQANEALLRTNHELFRSNQNLEEFAYAASHDLKEPVRKIHFFADRLKEELKDSLSETHKSLFIRMEHAARRMGSLIDDLLLYSHVSKGVSQSEKVDLNQKIKLVLEDLDLEVAEKKAMIEVGPLPVIRGHRRQLQQLFQNLIGNALKYSKSEPLPYIHISARQPQPSEYSRLPATINEKQNFCLVEVRDNGIGFEPEDAERIFNVFTRLHGNSEYRGTGVGLSIAKKVVENHGGVIWAESLPGEGSVFKMLLPLVEAK